MLQVFQDCKAVGLNSNPTIPLVYPLGDNKRQTTAGCLQVENPNFFRYLCHSWGKTQSMTPQAEWNLVCVLYFSPQALTWSKLLTSLVALLEAGKFESFIIHLLN